jgi:hypothetical protein
MADAKKNKDTAPRSKKTEPKKPIKKATSTESHGAVTEKIGAKMGRPTSYREEYVEQVYKLCLLGADDGDLAEFFEVSESTINNWKIAHPDFLESMKKGKVVADAEVAGALYRRAIGYSHPDEHISNYQGEVTVTPITKHIAPDVAAAFIWLKNRQPKKWRDKIEVKQEVDVNIFPPKEVLDEIYANALKVAAEREKFLAGRRERLGIVIDAEVAQDGGE